MGWAAPPPSRLAEAGADVALVARSEEDLRGTEDEVSGFGGRALVLPADLASVEETTGTVERTLEEFGRVDVLVNAAGTDAPGTVEELDVEGWDRTLDVNLRALFLLSKAVFASMREAGGGLILNVSGRVEEGLGERLGLLRLEVRPRGLQPALADEVRAHGIRAVVLYPGAMATNWGVWTPEERREREREEALPSRVLPPEEVAVFIVWLASAPPGFVLTEAIITPIEEGMP